MHSTQSYKYTTEMLVLFSAVVASTSTYWFISRREKDAKTNDEHKNDSLGPDKRIETKYQLNLRGKVDKIYEHHGPKPFEFNSEVVSVFDDMVSRSVPLYCEVIDLCIYWFQRYYRPDTKVYDLGCSTGTTLDILARAASSFRDDLLPYRIEFVGIDNSEAMVQACKDKLDWASKHHIIDIRCGDILGTQIENASFVVMNYTLQFVPVVRRQELLLAISNGLIHGGILFLSEKVRTECSEIQETFTWIYEDFKERRKYTKREIARKKEALMNVLIPCSEKELKDALNSAGFENVEIVAKWNNFTTFVARKKAPVTLQSGNDKRKTTSLKLNTPNLEMLFDVCPVYLSDYLEPNLLSSVCLERMKSFRDKGVVSNDTLREYDEVAKMILLLPKMVSKLQIFDQPELILGSPDELNSEQMEIFKSCLHALKPWRKGPVRLFGVKIDSEWRSDLKWERLQKSLPNLKDKVVCDLGCGNGYFMFRMLEYEPKLVMGIDPNFHAWLEFNLFQRISGVDNVKFEYLRGDIMSSLPAIFDVVFCLGVLYHTPDPIGMLKDIYNSMKKSSTLIVDCQGIPGEDHITLFPKKRYTNMKGVYFLPTLITLEHWLKRANFKNFEVIYNEVLSTVEQRSTDWAPVRSLEESLDPSDTSQTVEGYPRAHRFYVKVTR